MGWAAREQDLQLVSMKRILAVENLRFRRGKITILDGITWSVRPGEHWALIGANGCGKTTLLRTLTGYLSATSGEISLLGRRYGETDWRELRAQIGLVTSALQASIPSAETALETVMSGNYAQLDLWARTTANDAREARRWLRFVRIEQLAERAWLYLSQGERQRVLIARALIAKPRLLILDEPCAGLDPIAREDFLEFINRLARRKTGPALVLVTHHVEEIVPAFTHALLLRSGRVVAAGLRRETLTGSALSQTFGQPVKLSKRNGRLALSIRRSGRNHSA